MNRHFLTRRRTSSSSDAGVELDEIAPGDPDVAVSRQRRPEAGRGIGGGRCGRGHGPGRSTGVAGQRPDHDGARARWRPPSWP